MNLPDDPTPAELDMVIDEARKAIGEGPAPRSPEQGIADMKGRIAFLYKQKAAMLAQDTPSLAKAIDDINRDITEAEVRLREYEAQRGAGN